MLRSSRAHCAAQLATSPQAARHLQRMAAALRHVSTWLPVAPLLRRGLQPIGGGSGWGGWGGWGGVATVGMPGVTAASDLGCCLTVHCWLVLVVAYCLPCITIHRLEVLDDQECQLAEVEQRMLLEQHQQLGCSDVAAAEAEAVGGESSSAPGGARRLSRPKMLQQHHSLLGTAAELVIAAYLAWLAVQLAMPLVGVV